jgi:hypothetical protein
LRFVDNMINATFFFTMKNTILRNTPPFPILPFDQIVRPFLVDSRVLNEHAETMLIADGR